MLHLLRSHVFSAQQVQFAIVIWQQEAVWQHSMIAHKDIIVQLVPIVRLMMEQEVLKAVVKVIIVQQQHPTESFALQDMHVIVITSIKKVILLNVMQVVTAFMEQQRWIQMI